MSPAPAARPAPPAPKVTGDRPETRRRLARTGAEVQACVRALAGRGRRLRLGLDLETTGLDPRADRIRLLTLSDGRETWTVDCFEVDPSPLWPMLRGAELVGHFLQFDLAFLAPLGFEVAEAQPTVFDTILASRVLQAGRRGARHSLSACCERHLGLTLDKGLQASDWGGALSTVQLAYAASDAEVLLPLSEAMEGEIAAAALLWTLEIEHRALPAVVWMSGAGVPFDSEAWGALLAEAEAETAAARRELDAAAPAPPDRLFLDELGWNWDSPQEARRALALAVGDHPVGAALAGGGAARGSTADAVLAVLELSSPLAGLLRRYRRGRKRVGTYGTNWLAMVRAGRIYPTWSQLGRRFEEGAEEGEGGAAEGGAAEGSADVGRMTCAKPNFQQVPRATFHRPGDGRYRACVRAPEGRALVKADYAAIELRIAARVAFEGRLFELFAAGADLHAETARMLFGREEITPEERQMAKSANFGLLYGLSAAGFRAYCLAEGGLVLTEDGAAGLREKWFEVYPGIRAWHERTRAGAAEGAGETRSRAGRRRLLPLGSADTCRLNSPVQGTGADGLKTALALLWERRGECPGALPVLASHDEIVLECPEEDAPAAAAWLSRAMRDAMEPLIDPVPVEVEAKWGRTWGD